MTGDGPAGGPRPGAGVPGRRWRDGAGRRGGGHARGHPPPPRRGPGARRARGHRRATPHARRACRPTGSRCSSRCSHAAAASTSPATTSTLSLAGGAIGRASRRSTCRWRSRSPPPRDRAIDAGHGRVWRGVAAGRAAAGPGPRAAAPGGRPPGLPTGHRARRRGGGRVAAATGTMRGLEVVAVATLRDALRHREAVREPIGPRGAGTSGVGPWFDASGSLGDHGSVHPAAGRQPGADPGHHARGRRRLRAPRSRARPGASACCCCGWSRGSSRATPSCRTSRSSPPTASWRRRATCPTGEFVAAVVGLTVGLLMGFLLGLPLAELPRPVRLAAAHRRLDRAGAGHDGPDRRQARRPASRRLATSACIRPPAPRPTATARSPGRRSTSTPAPSSTAGSSTSSHPGSWAARWSCPASCSASSSTSPMTATRRVAPGADAASTCSRCSRRTTASSST